MSFGIVDVLMQRPGEAATFVADKLVDYVEITIPAGIHTGKLDTLDQRELFTLGDNFIILSVGFMLPEFFLLRNDTNYDRQGIELWVVKKGGLVRHDLPGLTHLWTPFEDYEMSLGMFFPGSGLEDPPIDDDFYLTSKFLDLAGTHMRISMVYVPPQLDGQTFHVPIFVKVLHNQYLYHVPA